MNRKCVYEITRKSPGKLRKGSIRALIYEVLKREKRAEEDKIAQLVMKDKNFRTRQADPAQQIKWYLRWGFQKEGLVRRVPDRRWRVSSNGQPS